VKAAKAIMQGDLKHKDWLEILGCGVIYDEVMKNAGRDIIK